MLKLEHISFTADDKEILKDINLTLDDHFIAITGPNGSGKSTLLKVIMGIITPDTGRILLDGEDITDLSITEHQLRVPAAGPVQGPPGQRPAGAGRRPEKG